jgi:hypothetical protein
MRKEAVVSFEKEYQFHHRDGNCSTIKSYNVLLDGKEYGVEVGNKERSSNHPEMTYVFSRGRYCKPDGVVAPWVEAHLNIAIRLGRVQ